MHKEEEDEEGEDDEDMKDGGGSNNGRAIGQRAKKGSNNLIKDRQPPPGQKGQSNMAGLFNQAAPYKGAYYAAEQDPLQEYARAGVPANYNTGGSVSQSS